MAELALNSLLYDMKDPEALVEDSEREYFSKLEELAAKICASECVRIVLLAGPSASGKTTTANILSDMIKARGKKSAVVSLDNFYRNATDKKYPRLEDGSRDRESPYALDLDMIKKVMENIVAGREFDVPVYDFETAARAEFTHYSSYAEGCVIIEGLHALNPIISDSFSKENVLKVFVSVSTNINDGNRRILSGRRLRFVRRVVRDSIYRATAPVVTVVMWQKVLFGEDMYLYPFKKLADVRFDTFHAFEPAVLKTYAEKLLTAELRGKSEYVNNIAKVLDIMPSYDSGIVPQTSLIREFIPGGVYEDLY